MLYYRLYYCYTYYKHYTSNETTSTEIDQAWQRQTAFDKQRLEVA